MLVILSYSAVEEWPQWRGPHRDGQVIGFNAPRPGQSNSSSGGSNVGLGHSSPVVADRKILYLQSPRRGRSARLRRAGRRQGIWQHGYPAPYQANPVAAMHGKGPKSTPMVSGGRVFTVGISGILTCWDAKSGKLVWQRDFSKQFEKPRPSTASRCRRPSTRTNVVHVGGPDQGALVALDVKNGETIWSCPEDGPGYASPVVATGRRAASGNAIAKSLHRRRSVRWQAAVANPLSNRIRSERRHAPGARRLDDLSGINKGVDRYRIEKQDDEWETDKTWENKEVSLYMSSPVADGERLFGFSHRHKGQFFAMDLTTGKTLWTSEGRLGDNASPGAPEKSSGP